MKLTSLLDKAEKELIALGKKYLAQFGAACLVLGKIIFALQRKAPAGVSMSKYILGALGVSRSDVPSVSWCVARCCEYIGAGAGHFAEDDLDKTPARWLAVAPAIYGLLEKAEGDEKNPMDAAKAAGSLAVPPVRFTLLTRLLFWMLLVAPLPARAGWVWMSAEQYLQESTLIAILDVGEIHQAWTPENILVESATAAVEKVVYYQFTSEEKLPSSIVVYTVDPNGYVFNGHGYHTSTPMLLLEKGRVFAMLKMRGMNKFAPYDRFSFESLATGKIRWPTQFGKDDELVGVDRVIDDLERLERTMKPKE